jgi:Ni/Co efflux regulator RcnB
MMSKVDPFLVRFFKIVSIKHTDMLKKQRERDRETERERETDRQRDREKEREKERRKKERKKERERERERKKERLIKLYVFQEGLIHYDKENIHPNIIVALDPYLKDKEFDPEFIRSKSAAAAGLCSWVINIVKFFEVWPKSFSENHSFNINLFKDIKNATLSSLVFQNHSFNTQFLCLQISF